MENDDYCQDCLNPAVCYAMGKCAIPDAKETADDRLDAATLFGFAPGEIVEAAWDITEGLHSTKVICDEGTELRVTGPSGNALHPIRVEKTNGSSWSCAVSASDIRKPNVQGMARRAEDGKTEDGLSPSPSPPCSHSSDSPMNHLPPVTEKGSPVGDETSEPEIHQPEMAVDLSGVPAGGTHHQNTIP